MSWTIRCGLILLIVLLPAGPFATTFPVTKTEDTNDGTCDADCSLREAIELANTNPGPDDVLVPAGTYLLTLGQLVVSDALDLAGAGQSNTIIDGNAASRVVDIEAISGVVAVSGVSIRNGYVPFRGVGGGIRSLADLTLINSTVSGNVSLGIGGGVGSREDLTLINSTVSGNTALNAGGGISNISGYGSLTLTNSTVSGNSTVDGDTAAIGSGGGIIQFSVYGNLTLTNSTVSGNTARGGGGGIYSTVDHGTIALINSTVSGNIASDRSGGGIWSDTYYFGNMTLTNSTVSDNRASLGGAGVYTGGYGWGTTAVTNTIIGDNQGSTPNCHGVLVLDSLGYNLTDDDSCGFIEHSDLIVNNVGLGRLQNNGGPTETHDLLTNSPAIDAGGNCPPPATDQRGVPRPQGAACDIGSVEYLPEPRRLLALIVGTGIIGFLHRRKR